MVNPVCATVLILALAAAGGQPDAGKVVVSVIAVQATNEGRAARINEAPATETKPKRTATMPFLQQGFAPGLNKPKPKKQDNGDHRYFDSGLEGIRSATESLPFDTYKKLKSETTAIPFGKETPFEINGRYKLRLGPLDKDNMGRLRINVAVDQTTNRDGQSQTVTALQTTSAIAPNKYVVLGGRLPLEEGGQLIICVSTQN